MNDRRFLSPSSVNGDLSNGVIDVGRVSTFKLNIFKYIQFLELQHARISLSPIFPRGRHPPMAIASASTPTLTTTRHVG